MLMTLGLYGVVGWLCARVGEMSLTGTGVGDCDSLNGFFFVRADSPSSRAVSELLDRSSF